MSDLPGILAGTDWIVDRHLLGTVDHARHYQHKGEASNLKREFDAEAMLRKLIQQIRKNLREHDPDSVGSSNENWRAEVIKPDLGSANTSKEVLLERKIAQALLKKGEKDWWNQMPIASGLISVTADRRRAVDLVHRFDPEGSRYDFVELKVDSDTPVFALMEILRHGLVYLVLRKEPDWLPEIARGQPVFKAHDVGLRVLAPKDFFEGYDLVWLEARLNEALPRIIEEQGLESPLIMQVSSHWSPQHTEWCEAILSDDPRLLSFLSEWEAAFPS